jgi:aspartate racemase
MRTIGILGGMSFEGTSSYYRFINEAVRDRLGGSHSAKIILYSVDFQEIIDLQQANRLAEAGEYLGGFARTLDDAGADCVLMACNTMHMVADAIVSRLTVPFIDIVDETAKKLSADGRTRPFLIATRYTMEHGFYQTGMARNGVVVTTPDDADRATVHTIIFDELCQGKILEGSRAALVAMIEQAKADGADSVILGCTELGLILDGDALPLPAYDSTILHAEAAVAFALDLQGSRS